MMYPVRRVSDAPPTATRIDTQKLFQTGAYLYAMIDCHSPFRTEDQKGVQIGLDPPREGKS